MVKISQLIPCLYIFLLASSSTWTTCLSLKIKSDHIGIGGILNSKTKYVFSGFMGMLLANHPHSVFAGDLTTTRNSVNFNEFIQALNNNEVTKTVFNGVNPKSVTVYFKTGEVLSVGEAEGFPVYDDPLSPSGPTQVIARVQHTPGVICEQDVSGAMSFLRKQKDYKIKEMLTHNPYPTTYAYDPFAYKGGEDTKYLKRYEGKEDAPM